MILDFSFVTEIRIKVKNKDYRESFIKLFRTFLLILAWIYIIEKSKTNVALKTCKIKKLYYNNMNIIQNIYFIVFSIQCKSYYKNQSVMDINYTNLSLYIQISITFLTL